MVEEVINEVDSSRILQHEMEDDIGNLLDDILNERDEGKLESSELNEAKMEMFRRLCLKDYLDRCEPVNCVFRLTGTCEYIKIIGKLNEGESRRIQP